MNTATTTPSVADPTPVQLFDPASGTCTYVLFDALTREALIIDPVDTQIERDLRVLREMGLRLRLIVETHAHADHITSAGALAEHTGARTAAPSGCRVLPAAIQLVDGDVLSFGGESLRAVHTPGHTAGSMSFLWRHHVFTGDTLLIDGCGRSDFQSGDAGALYGSITRVLFALPDDTVVWPGHDYKGRTHSSIGAERATNARVTEPVPGAPEGTRQMRSREAFIELMGQLNLPTPRRMAEAVPANLVLGLRHDASPEAAARPATSAELGYAGDVPPQVAHQWWTDGEAALVDVRTDAEREWVGFVPGAQAIAWKQWPGMAVNAQFDAALAEAVPAGGRVMFLCRSGVRSIAAARRATELGYEAWNILEGFEGDPDEQAHRGRKGGWRLRGLPWRQG